MTEQPYQGDRQMAGVSGWGPGAEKSGNADGVKVPTADGSERANIFYTQR